MAEILGNYDVLKKFDQSFKQTISKLYIFGNKGENVIIVNSNDDVIVFGDNTDGMLGLGHTNAVLKPTKIHQLCGQNIIEFSNGITHVTALSADGKVYGWGQIETMPQNENFKPKLLSNLNGEKIKQICCGFSHSFALSESGKLFAWGSNKCGQLGLGDKICRSEPIQISGLRLESITEISCGSLHSMALTSSGQVFIWGFNNWENSNNGKINEMNNNNKNSSSPYLLNVENNNGKVAVIKKIVCGSHHSVLLSEERDIYTFGQNYCSQLGNGNKRHRNNPGLIKLARKFIDIAASHHSTISIALSEDNVYCIWGEYEKSKMNGSICVSKPTPCDLKSFHAIFTHYCKPNITYRTVDTSLMSIEKSKNSQIIKKNKYREEFREKGILGTGSFSIVCKARSNVDKEFYAIKIIPLNNFKGLLEETKEFRELKIMQKLRSDLVVQYTQHWIEENYTRNDKNYFKRHQNTETLSSEHKVFDKSKEFLLHIQMELCCKTLRDIIKQLNIELNQKQSEVLTPIGYYIASELLVEILESVDYLHSQKPPIIHRDLKPTNILITQGLNDRFVKIADFGLATIHEFEEQSHTEGTGTLKYMAQEVAKDRKYDTKADIYSLGVIVQELFNFDINKEITEENNVFSLRDKYKNLCDFANRMTNNQKNNRPNCVTILRDKYLWALSCDDLENDSAFNEIRNRKNSPIDIENNFRTVFIKKKLKTQKKENKSNCSLS